VYYDDRRAPFVHLDGYRTVADKNTDKKQKTQKVKSKALTVEAKKHLASVRVIQRNLVYIIGLPANLCNESVRTIFSTSRSNFLTKRLNSVMPSDAINFVIGT
jgi:hypothetical protein